MDYLEKTLEALKVHAERIATRSYVPYSGEPAGIVILLEDGSLIAGVRVENASFPLTISALQNAITTAYSLQRTDFSILVSTIPFTEAELAYTSALGAFQWELVAANILMVAGAHHPDPTDFLPLSKSTSFQTPEEGILAARASASKAFVPHSQFPVGCAVSTNSSQTVLGVNVEHSDWSKILCAERNALSTMVSYDLGEAQEIFVSCVKLAGASPCGACRQVIVELAPQATVWMDFGSEKPQAMKAKDLLPGHFSGDVLRRS